MNLSKYDRKKYIKNESPIEFLDNLTEYLNGPNIYIKRDDKLTLSIGGNKVRKLEFLMADAILKSADTIITCGAVQSNHCCLTLSAANKENMECYFVLEERVPNSYTPDTSGNNFLYKLLGTKGIRIVSKGTDMMKAMGELAEELKDKGKNPYIIPGGGSNKIGALGYISCAQEIVKQTKQMGIKIDKILVASGSGGTHSGILSGIIGLNSKIPVIGIGVNKNKDEQVNLIWNKVVEMINMLNIKNEFSMNDVIVFDEYIGDGYSLPTEKMIEAVQLMAHKESILLDPVYTGKAVAGMIDLIKKGYFDKNENILFIHTGGSSALFAYENYFKEKVGTIQIL